MKKLFALLLALTLVLSMAACGGGSEPAPAAAPASSAAAPAASKAPAPPASSAAPAASKAPAPPAPAADLKNPSYSPEQLAVAEKFAAMSDRFSALGETINADESLSSIEELVDTMNVLITAVNEDDALFADPANLTAEVLKNLEGDIALGNSYLDELEAMVKNYAGKKTITIPVEITNSTGVDIHTLAMSPANDTNWGANMLDQPLKADETGVTMMTFTEDTLVWDMLAADSEGTALEFMGLDFSEVPTTGAKLLLSATEGGAYMASFAM